MTATHQSFSPCRPLPAGTRLGQSSLAGRGTYSPTPRALGLARSKFGRAFYSFAADRAIYGLAVGVLIGCGLFTLIEVLA